MTQWTFLSPASCSSLYIITDLKIYIASEDKQGSMAVTRSWKDYVLNSIPVLTGNNNFGKWKWECNHYLGHHKFHPYFCRNFDKSTLPWPLANQPLTSSSQASTMTGTTRLGLTENSRKKFTYLSQQQQKVLSGQDHDHPRAGRHGTT
jgi:hypothetical protein